MQQLLRTMSVWLLALAPLFPATAPAQFADQPDTTLARLTTEAFRSAPRLLQGAEMSEAMTLRARAAGTLPDPHLSLGVMDLTLPRFAFRESDFTEVDVEVSQLFPWPGTLRARTRAASADATVVAADLAGLRRSIALRVAQAYYQLRYAVTAESTLVQQRRLLDAAVDLSTSRYATGSVGQSDPLRARVAIARLDAEAASLRGEADGFRADLRALRGVVDRHEQLDITPFDLVAVRHAAGTSRAFLDEPDSLQRALALHPQLIARQAEVTAAEERTKIEALSGRPDFSVIARYGGRPLGADFFSAFVGVRIPLWAGRKQHVLADAARRDAEAARHALGANGDALTAELDRARADARAEGVRLDLLLDRVLPLADEEAAAALREYRTGQADVLRLLTAQDGQYRVRLEAAAAAARYLTSVVAIQQLTRTETTP